MSRLFTQYNKDGLHSHNALSYALEFLANKFYLAVIGIRPTTTTIYNVATTTSGWTAVATGLTNVLSWRLSERGGGDFYYCYDGVGTTYMSGWGWVSKETAITAIYVKRIGATNINAQLEVDTP